MKTRWFILSLILMIGALLMPEKTTLISSLDSTTNYATRFLKVRPESTRPHDLTLTLNQLLSFKNHVFLMADRALNDLHDVNREEIERLKAVIAMDLVGLNESEFERNFEKYYDLYEDLFTLYAHTLESRSVEGRGVWHRPFETNLTAVRQTLEALHDIGINMLFVETFWMGRLIYPSNVPHTFQHGFTLNGYRDETVDYGNNLLVAFIEEAKAFDIEVHAWVENFFVGFGTDINGSPILQAKPEWAQFNHDGTIPQKFETNYLFMDPANPEVREYLKQLYVEMAGFEGVASIHLDYIRYPVNTNPRSATNNGDTGYSAIAEREFKYLYGYTGDLRTLVIENAQAARDWQAYKTSTISSFVSNVFRRIKSEHPDVYLSTAIFGNVDNAIQTKNQDWKSWIDKGYIEMILPMAYYQSSLTVRNEAQKLNEIVGSNAFSYVGIAPTYMGFNDHLNTTQIHASLDAGSQGVTFFASQNYLIQHFNGRTTHNVKAQNILRQGTFRNAAILPHGDLTEVVNVSLEDMLDRAQRLFIPAQAMTQTQKEQLTTVFESWRQQPLESNDDLKAMLELLDAFSFSPYASGAAALRLQESLDYLILIINIHYTRGQWRTTIDLSVDPNPRPQLPPLITLAAPENLRLEEAILRWDADENARRFRVYINGQGLTVNEPAFDLREINLFEGALVIAVKAVGDDVSYSDSLLSVPLNHQTQRLKAPTQLRVRNDVLIFNPAEGAQGYRIRIGTQNIITQDHQLHLTSLDLPSQTLSISVTSLGNRYETLDSTASQSIRYAAQDLRLQNTFKSLLLDFAKTIVTSGE